MNGPSENTLASTDAKSDRSRSKSPGGTPNNKSKTNGRDVGHDVQDNKIGFREDARALRVLDRRFGA